MNKAESLKALKQWGFNTPEFTIVQPGRYFTELPSHKYDKFGIRTCTPSGKGFSLPFLREVAAQDVPDHVDRLARGGYIVIIGSWYPKEWLQYSLHIQMDTMQSGLIEYLEGPSIVRDVQHAKDFKTLRFTHLNSLSAPFTGVIQECADIYIFNNAKPCIIEASIMDRSVGVQDKEVVFWEIRDV